MKNIIWIVGLLALMGIVCGAELESGDRLYVTCNNATDGSLLGATGTLKCWDKAGNVDVNGESLVNVETGVFYYVFSETNDRYWCRIDCVAGAVDYMIPVWQRTTPLIDSNNIGIDWSDIDNPTTAVDLSATDIQLVDTATAVTNGVDLNSTLTASLNAIETDTSAVDTTSEMRIFLTGSDVPIADNTTLAIVLVDTNEIQGNQTNFVTATGFSTHNETDVWGVGTRTLSGFTASWIDSEAISEAELNSAHGTGMYNASSSCASTADVTNARDNIKANVSAEAGRVMVNTSAEHDRTMDHGDLYWNGSAADVSDLATQANLTSGIVALTSATEAQIDYIVNGSLVDDIFDEATSGHVSAGSFGKLLADIFNAIFSWGGGGGW